MQTVNFKAEKIANKSWNFTYHIAKHNPNLYPYCHKYAPLLILI